MFVRKYTDNCGAYHGRYSSIYGFRAEWTSCIHIMNRDITEQWYYYHKLYTANDYRYTTDVTTPLCIYSSVPRYTRGPRRKTKGHQSYYKISSKAAAGACVRARDADTVQSCLEYWWAPPTPLPPNIIPLVRSSWPVEIVVGGAWIWRYSFINPVWWIPVQSDHPSTTTVPKFTYPIHSHPPNTSYTCKSAIKRSVYTAVMHYIIL